MADLEKLADQLSELTILEAAELTKILEEKKSKHTFLMKNPD